MKRFWVLALAAAMTPIAAARVWVTVYQYDGKTPLAAVDADHPTVYRGIMVGTRLTLVVSSDSSAYLMGSLWVPSGEATYGKLSGRGLTPPAPNSVVQFSTYPDSVLNAAGTKAYVRDDADSTGSGLDLTSDHIAYFSDGHPAYPGAWFVVDYHAEQVGHGEVDLYDNMANFNVPIQTLSFTQVPSRDFNHDTTVSFPDFACFASRWRSTAPPGADPTAAFDLNANGRVDFGDFVSFSQRWLEQIDSPIPPVPVKVFNEGWETATAGIYTVGSTIQSDAGSWLVGSVIPQFGGCAVSQQQAEIVAENGNHTLQLRSVESHSGCEDGVAVTLQEINDTNVELNIPLTADTVLSFKEVGELTNPQVHDSGRDCLFPPCFDNISLLLGDNNRNYLLYVLQRFPKAVANVPNSNYLKSYREVFLDPTAGSYRLHPFADFQAIPGFYPVRAKITCIRFQVDQHGSAILEDLVIGPQTTGDPMPSAGSPSQP